MDYQEFLKSKKRRVAEKGKDISIDQIHPKLFDFQKAVTKWAVKMGRAALFLDTGLGKTFCQLEWARQIHNETGKDILIIAPLAVSNQTKREAEKMDLNITICRSQVDVKPGINITNYEMADEFNEADFIGVVLDESSILKNYTGKRKQLLVDKFQNTPFRLCCTATPSPNDHMEILNHAEFLGVMKSNQALAIWFINDTMNFGSYRLKNHARREFWEWVNSWSIAMSNPSDLGFDNDGFVLPKLIYHEHVIKTDFITGKNEDELFRIPSLSATSFHKEKRISLHERALQTKAILDGLRGEQVCIWVDTNYEADALNDLIEGAIEVRGSDSREFKEQSSIAFVNGEIKTLIAKPKIFGFGLNFQNCHNVIFMGVNFSFESFYQAVRRFWRFGQQSEVNVHLILSATEKGILSILHKKERLFEELKKELSSISALYHKDTGMGDYHMDYNHNKTKGDNYTLILGDSVIETKNIASDSIGLQIWSPPFSNLYIYSASHRDMGNTLNDKEFFKQMDFLIPELFRINMPGRLCVVHCKDLVDYMNRDGAFGIRDFPGDIIRAMEKHGWKYHSRVTIWKDPVIEMQRTKSHGLLWKNFTQRSEVVRMGLPDYLLVFKKWVEEIPDKQITRDIKGGDFFFGEAGPSSWDSDRDYSIQVWQHYASPVWFDIRQTNVLNTEIARDDKDEKHIAPLQLDVIARAIEIWSNPGDTVFSPFMGIGSEGYVALQMKRKFIGIELKDKYFEIAVKNIKIVSDFGQMTLFNNQ